MARGSFHEDWGDLLKRFGSQDPEARIGIEVRQATPDRSPPRGCKFFVLNERLAERSLR